MHDQDDDPWWWEGASDATPQPDLDVADVDEPPRLLGPDGEPLPRLVFRFGFHPSPVWE